LRSKVYLKTKKPLLYCFQNALYYFDMAVSYVCKNVYVIDNWLNEGSFICLIEYLY
jgi:hypothetical protein